MTITTNFHDTAQFFANSIGTFLRQDEEYRSAWRYKHRQEALKIPRRESLKTACAWAAMVADHLSMQETPNTMERYAGKMWEAWEAHKKARETYFDEKSAANLTALKEAELTLKSSVRSLNALLQ